MKLHCAFKWDAFVINLVEVYLQVRCIVTLVHILFLSGNLLLYFSNCSRQNYIIIIISF
jgi:hypothetical protein